MEEDILKNIYNRIDRFKEAIGQKCFNIAINDLKCFKIDIEKLKKLKKEC